MNKLRDNTGVVLWILVIAFGLIWVLQDSGMFDTLGAGGMTNIIVVDGDPISYEEYTRALNAQMEQYQAQTGESMPPQMVDLTRDRVFDALVEDRLREREMERLGIRVTDEEVYQLIMGDNPHPIIQMYFGDGQGGVNRTLLQNFYDDPDAREQQIQLEQFIRAERRREKLDNLIAATVRVSDQDVLDEYQRRNRRVDTRYVALRYAAIPDDSVQVTDRDLRAFYDAHRDEFERARTYAIDYVALSKDPTPEDTALVVGELERLRARFAEAEDDSLFLARNASEQPYTDAYFRPDELDPQVARAVFQNPEPGRIVGPVVAGDQAHLIKIRDVRPAEETAVRARHILFSAPQGDDAQRAAARRQAEETLQLLRQGADFAEQARQKSADPGSAVQGGDLGWFGPGRMVAPFEEAAMSAPVGRVVGPVETDYGYHLIEVTDRATQEVQLADYALRVRADVTTLGRIEEKLEDLQYYATESGDFLAEAQRLDLNVQQMQVEENQQFLPGIGNSRTLLTFLGAADEGEVSPVIELNDQFVVAHVRDITPAGYRSLDDVRAEIEPRARLEKKKAIQVQRLQQALQQHGFDGLAAAVNEQERVAAGLTFNNPVVTGLGREPKFVGTALGLEPNATSGVVSGENAAYVLKVTDVHEPAEITDAQREQIRQQLLNQRRSQVQNQWLASLRQEADVEDLRPRFQQ